MSIEGAVYMKKKTRREHAVQYMAHCYCMFGFLKNIMIWKWSNHVTFSCDFLIVLHLLVFAIIYFLLHREATDSLSHEALGWPLAINIQCRNSLAECQWR